MKKLVIFLIIVLFVGSTCSCNSTIEETNFETENKSTESQIETNETNEITTDETERNDLIGDPWEYTYEFDTIGEYNNILLQKSPHRSFVFFDDISYIGELSKGYGTIPISEHDKHFNGPYCFVYKIQNKNCSIHVSREKKDNFLKLSGTEPIEIDIEDDSLIYHNMPPTDEIYNDYSAYEYRMDFEDDGSEYRVRYIYSLSDPSLAAISIVRKIDSYYLRFFISFTEDYVGYNIAWPFAYDMSNEEINKFLSKETAKEAIVKLYTSHLEAVESRSGN